jgi:phage repressor protein C with HTH and peptisase S24 domain
MANVEAHTLNNLGARRAARRRHNNGQPSTNPNIRDEHLQEIRNDLLERQAQETLHQQWIQQQSQQQLAQETLHQQWIQQQSQQQQTQEAQRHEQICQEEQENALHQEQRHHEQALCYREAISQDDHPRSLEHHEQDQERQRILSREVRQWLKYF